MKNPRPLLTALTALIMLSPIPARADDDRLMPAKVPPAYRQECAACHTAYPPGMLPAASWQRIMNGLDKHYGSDASLDAATVKQLSTWLQAHTGTYRRANTAPPEDRITQSAWFKREHRQVDDAVWRHASVKTAANCVACHSGADQGDFDEDSLRIPPGLNPRQRRAWHD